MKFWIIAGAWLVISILFAVANARFHNAINPLDDEEGEDER